MWGFSEEQIAEFGLTFGVGAFMLYMVFIIVQLARDFVLQKQLAEQRVFFRRVGNRHVFLCVIETWHDQQQCAEGFFKILQHL